MKILIVEDDANKLKRLSETVKACTGEAQVIEARSYQRGLSLALTGAPDLIILDMTMPNYEVTVADRGGRTRAFAGADILRELQRKAVASKAIIVTQFESFGEKRDAMTLDQLKDKLSREYPLTYLGTVFYQASESGWIRDFEALIFNAFPSTVLGEK